jgi:hypothetical protein
MQPRACGFAYGAQVPHIGAAAEIRVDAPAGEMGGRHDGDPIARNVHPVGEAMSVDCGEALENKRRLQCRQVQVNAFVAAGGHMQLDRARDDVAGSKRTQGMNRVHESPTLPIGQHGTLPP